MFDHGKYCCKIKRNSRANLLLPSHKSCATKEKRRMARKKGYECCKRYIPCSRCTTTSIKPPAAPIAPTGNCPKTHPHVYYNGGYCCQSGKEKVYAPQGDKCDGSAIQRNSLCCEGDKFVKCPLSNCNSFQGSCPATHPHVYYNGQYCCQSEKEKVYAPQGDKCDGSAIRETSLCCEGDKYIRCPSGHCHSFIGCPATHKRAFRGNHGIHCCKAQSSESTLLLPSHEKCSSPSKRKSALNEGHECCDNHIPCPHFCPLPAPFWGA
ncbi:hypothetical protein ACHWQZ_G017243 [Mnemiopsis leidyi]